MATDQKMLEIIIRATDEASEVFEKLSGGVELSMAAAGAAITAFGAGLTIALSNAGDEAASFASEVVKVQRLTGASAEEASTFAAMLDRLGISADGAAKIIKTLDVAVASDAEFLIDAGIATRDLTGEHRNAIAVLRDVAEKYATTANKTDAVAFASKALGKSWAEMLPILAGGAAGIDKLAKQASDAGMVFSQETVRALSAYNKATKDSEVATKGLTIQLGLMVMPLKTWMQEQLVKLLGTINKLPQPAKDAAGGLAIFTAGVADIVGPMMTTVALFPDLLKGLQLIKGVAVASGLMKASVVADSAGAAAGLTGAGGLGPAAAVVGAALAGFTIGTLLTEIPAVKKELQKLGNWIGKQQWFSDLIGVHAAEVGPAWKGPIPGYAAGGLATGPSSGYLAMLHGTELIVPLSGGRSGGTFGASNINQRLVAVLERIERNGVSANVDGRELNRAIGRVAVQSGRSGAR